MHLFVICDAVFFCLLWELSLLMFYNTISVLEHLKMENEVLHMRQRFYQKPHW